MQAARGASLNPSDTTDDADPAGDPPATPRRTRYLLVFGLVAALGYATDVVTKVLAVEHLTGRAPVRLVGDVLTMYLARNPGAAFSTGTSYTIVLTFVAITAALVVLWVSRRLGSTGWAIGLGFLLAGVLGNLTDRVFRSPGFLHGHVVDFLRLPHWPIFNVADVCINIAAAVIILQAVRGVTITGLRTSRPARGSGPDRSDDPGPAS
ncbi:MAG: signal peptidase II [Nocardioidaceae bacterium]|nr:signal peptidase II [Nocardioidaceae bacterium]NUS50430.1 signal peptidase II [Nocardioidaceae bacterium]